MPKGSPELTQARKNEIINACKKLYKTKNFKEITLKEISSETSFTRTSIYNYFQTKEEIFLALFKAEYEFWTMDLGTILNSNEYFNASSLAEKIAKTLEERKLMLKILSVNLYDLEENSRLERLVEFKKTYRSCIQTLDKLLLRFFPHIDEDKRIDTVRSMLIFTHGLYPYAFATDKQKEAMEKAGVLYDKKSIYELAFLGIKKILIFDTASENLEKN